MGGGEGRTGSGKEERTFAKVAELLRYLVLRERGFELFVEFI